MTDNTFVKYGYWKPLKENNIREVEYDWNDKHGVPFQRRARVYSTATRRSGEVVGFISKTHIAVLFDQAKAVASVYIDNLTADK